MATAKRNSTKQHDRFVEAARQLGCDESEPRFDEALKRVGKAKLTHPSRPSKDSKSKDGDASS